MAAPQSLTVRRRRLGHELRELRERVGLTLDEAAARLEDISAAKISRIETAKVGVRPRDVEALLDAPWASRHTAAHKSRNPYP